MAGETRAPGHTHCFLAVQTPAAVGKTIRVLQKEGERGRKRSCAHTFLLSVTVFDTVREGGAKSSSMGGSVTHRHFDRPVGHATRYEAGGWKG